MNAPRWIVALLLGTIGALLIAGLGYINDSVLRLTYLVGNHLPISVFGLLILMVILINPILSLISPRAQLSKGQMALIVMMMLAAASIPGAGLMRTFTPALTMPWTFNETLPAWKSTGVLSEEYMPPQMLLPNDQEFLDPLQTGYEAGGNGIPMGEMFSDPRIRWAEWAQPLSLWIPLVLLMSVGVLCLSVLVHPQWSKREHLRYPVADFATTLMGDDPALGGKSIIRNRVFWFGLVAILFVRVINGVHAWYPGFLEIPMEYDFRAILAKSSYLAKAPNTWAIYVFRIFPTVIAFAFFLASDVSLSIGLTLPLVGLITPALILNDVDISGDYMSGGPSVWQLIGSYGAMGLMLVYTGRHYYWKTLRNAFTFQKSPGVENYGTWAMRGFLLCAAGMLAVMIFWLELEWPFAVVMVGSLFLMFTVMARINAESGLFFLQPNWQPLGLMLGLFGGFAMGPRAMVIVTMMTMILTIDPREALMPFAVTGLKIAEKAGVQPRRAGLVMPGIFLLGLAVAVPIVIWSNYHHGMPLKDTWGTGSVPKMLNHPANEIQELKNSDLLEESEGLSTSERITEGLFGGNNPKRGKFLSAIGLGALAVLLVSVLRLRFTWWPIHPVIFLLWNTMPLRMFGHCILAGWVIRTLVERLAGQPAYRTGRIFMVGVIAGDLLGGLVFMAIGGIYYSLTGTVPPAYSIFPN